ncbi:MAG: hypothetical protein IIA61_09610 [Candidatus Marinimicrobia bacterium]|nr:hypothetical protein [Candidatus Neomarinimicrobiota bacterium]
MIQQKTKKDLLFTGDQKHQIVRELGRNPNKLEWVILSSYWNHKFVRDITKRLIDNLPKVSHAGNKSTSSEESPFYYISGNISVGFELFTCSGFNKEEVNQKVFERIYHLNNKLSSKGAVLAGAYCWMGLGKKNKVKNRLIKQLVTNIQNLFKGLKLKKSKFDFSYDRIFNDQSIISMMTIGIRQDGEDKNESNWPEGNLVFLISPNGGFTNWENNFNMGILARCMVDRQYVVNFATVDESGLIETVIHAALKGKTGISVDTDQIPSFDRRKRIEHIVSLQHSGGLLVIVSKGFQKEIKILCKDNGVYCHEIGYTDGSENFHLVNNEKKLVSIPLSLFESKMEHQPVNFAAKKRDVVQNLDLSSLLIPKDLSSVLLEMLKSENVVKQENDFISVNDITELISGSHSLGELIVVIENHTRYMKLDPRVGTSSTILGAIRRIVSRGANPIGIIFTMMIQDLSDKNNYYLFKESMYGVTDVCNSMGIPYFNSDISFSNSSFNSFVFTGGAVGLLENSEFDITSDFKSVGDFILMLGSHRGELGGTEYLEQVHSRIDGTPPTIDFAGEKRVIEILSVANRGRLIKSASPVAAGGLAVVLGKSVIRSDRELGVRVHMSSKIRDDELLFGETQGLFIISVDEDALIEIERLCMRFGVSCTAIGRVTDSGLFTINKLISLEVKTMKKAYLSSKKKIFGSLPWV